MFALIVDLIATKLEFDDHKIHTLFHVLHTLFPVTVKDD